MKRSEINNAIDRTIRLLEQNKQRLPHFAYWSPEQWATNVKALQTIRQTGLGWDVTDFGSGDFTAVGSVLFTLRNGLSDGYTTIGTPYAEKMIVQQDACGQETPFHFHRLKTEDLINRGGGVLMLELYCSTADDALDIVREVRIYRDGFLHTLPAGAVVEVQQGDSITLTPGLFHRFWAKKGTGDLIAWEVSSVNDDKSDNVFLLESKRFTQIEEDEKSRYLLRTEYEF